MADRSPDPTPDDTTPDGTTPDGDATETEVSGRPSPLSERWWWSGGVLAMVGVVVVGWQWDVIGKGEAIAATWVMVALGVGVAAMGAAWLWRDRPKRSSDS